MGLDGGVEYLWAPVGIEHRTVTRLILISKFINLMPLMVYFACAFTRFFLSSVNTGFATASINGNETVCTESNLIVNKWEEGK